MRLAELPATVLLAMVTVPLTLKRPPPRSATLPDGVLLTSVGVPWLAMPPPKLLELPETVLRVSVSAGAGVIVDSAAGVADRTTGDGALGRVQRALVEDSPAGESAYHG